MNPTIVLATGNPHKVVEYRKMLPEFHIITLHDLGFNDDVEETGTTFAENAMIKAQAAYDFLQKHPLEDSQYVIIGEDGGLIVDALDGAPGVYSGRYAGEPVNNAANRAKLLRELSGKPRSAMFSCTIAIIFPDGHTETVVGETTGEITESEKGDSGFSYDAVFYSHELGKTFGEATEDEKNRVSHRGRAIQKLRDRLSAGMSN